MHSQIIGLGDKHNILLIQDHWKDNEPSSVCKCIFLLSQKEESIYIIKKKNQILLYLRRRNLEENTILRLI